MITHLVVRADDEKNRITGLAVDFFKSDYFVSLYLNGVNKIVNKHISDDAPIEDRIIHAVYNGMSLGFMIAAQRAPDFITIGNATTLYLRPPIEDQT